MIKTFGANIFKEFSLSLFNTSPKKYFEPLVNFYLPKQSLTRKLAQVICQQKEMSDVMTLTLQPPKRWKGFTAGQFVELTFEIDGARYKRIFSISSSEQLYKQKRQIQVTIKKQYKGKVTEWLFEQDLTHKTIAISDAMGAFILNPTIKKNILLIAGGSGITPIKSIVESYAESDKSITLVYYARTNQHLFQTILEETCRVKGIKLHFIDTEKEGRINSKHLDLYFPNFTTSDIYVCGPVGMIKQVKQLGKQYNVSSESIVSELFHPVSYTISDNLKKEGVLCITNQPNLKIISDGTTSILRLTAQNNITIKSGCKMGICHQCKCEKTSGVVLNTLNNTLSDTGKEMIQACISVPVGDVYINI